MKTFREIISGLGYIIISSLVALGAISLSLTEGGIFVLPTVVPEETLISPVLSPNHPLASFQVSTPTYIYTLTVPTACPAPSGWIPYQIQPGDSISSLSDHHQTTQDSIRLGNCLVSDILIPGTILFLPLPAFTSTPYPTITPSPIPCSPPRGWIQYTVQPHDTLFGLSIEFGVSVRELQFANCLGSSTLIIAGQKLFVPNIPTRTVQPTSTPRPPSTPTRTQSPTATQTMSPSITPTFTFTPTPTFTPTVTGTFTPTSTSTYTVTNTITPTEVYTATPDKDH